jgi:ergothioneine biosynthesis protein EgtB
MMPATSTSLDRSALLDRYAAIRERTRVFFDVLDGSLYYTRPIALRNPIVFYEGHLPAFAVNALVKKALGRPGIDAHLEDVFARGIDPDSEATAVARGNPAWPSREEVRNYAAAAERLIADAIGNAELERDDHPMLKGAQALWTILEHEEMHQETLAYMWHQVPHALKRKPDGYVTLPESHLLVRAGRDRVRIPAGAVTVGTVTSGPATNAGEFAWDNELPAHRVHVDAFSIDANNVTNAAYLEFLDAGGYEDERWWRAEDWEWVRSERVTNPPFWQNEAGRWYWNGMFERVPLPESWPVYVTWAEARAYAAWRGLRLPSEAEFHRAAYGTPSGGERRYPWGDASPDGRLPGNFDFERWDPEPAGLRPESVSAFGVHDLVGNGWEWTASVFGPFDGFVQHASYPEYSADFFDGEHFVMKGASPLTARGLVRPGFRNWFRPRYPFVYAAFRCAGPA